MRALNRNQDYHKKGALMNYYNSCFHAVFIEINLTQGILGIFGAKATSFFLV
jgi:hypothetical protein